MALQNIKISHLNLQLYPGPHLHSQFPPASLNLRDSSRAGCYGAKKSKPNKCSTTRVCRCTPFLSCLWTSDLLCMKTVWKLPGFCSLWSRGRILCFCEGGLARREPCTWTRRNHLNERWINFLQVFQGRGKEHLIRGKFNGCRPAI